jgi:nicotinamidase-related amidase
MSLYNHVSAGVSNRYDFRIRPDKTALLIIDIQKYLVSNEPYLANIASPRTITNINKLTTAFRKIRDGENTFECNASSGCEVIFTYLQCLTNDGRDISLDYKLSGPFLTNIPRASCPLEDIFLPECYPDVLRVGRTTGSKGDILIPKTSCSVFRSTNIDYVLRNLRIEQLVITGQITNQCIESAVRDAADSGYFVTVVNDACSAHSEDDHERGLLNMKGFCRILSTIDVLKELGD